MKTKLLTIGLKYFSLAAMALGFVLAAGTAKATAVTCASLAPADVDPTGSGSSITCYVGTAGANLTFSNFQYANNGGDPSPSITLENPQPSPCYTAATYCLGLNPNLTGGTTEDLHLIFEVVSTAGAITSVTLADTGGTAPDGIGEHVCDANGITLSGTCSDGSALLASLAVANYSTASATLTTASTTIWIWKDINVQAGGHLSGIEEGFNTGAVSGVPEPMTLSMMGVGLLGLGLLGRRLRK